MLAVENLHVQYGRIAAVRGVTLSVGRGEIVALLGPNGSGKSSTLAAIAGLVRPRAGTILLNGADLLRLVPEDIVRQGVALVPENRRIFGHLTVEENLRLGATVRKDREAVQSDTAKILERFTVLQRLYRKPAGGLSGGEQQQLAIARALLSRPKLLLLDEPSLGLAPLLVNRVFEIVADLRREGTTILLAEQYVTRALGLADRVYSLSRGELSFAGTAAELRTSADFEVAYLAGLASRPEHAT
jgi:branched-chain amino acid transport system ATP-binding protein